MNRQDEMHKLKVALKQEIEQKINNSQFEIALQIIKEYEKVQPADADIFGFKGFIYYMLGELDQAEKYFKQGSIINSYKTELCFNLGIVYYDTHRFDKAYQQFKKIVSISNDALEIEQAEQYLRNIEENYPEYIGEKTSDRKQVLIIAHIFPPIGGSGVQRTLKFVKYLQQYGWQPTILTVGDTVYPLIDASLLNEVPDDIEIIRIDEPVQKNNVQDIRELMNYYSDMLNCKELIDEYIESVEEDHQEIQFPDPYIFWGIHAIRKAKQLFKQGQFDLIYSTSGPYTDHVIGYELKQYLGAPWVVDFRDEWTNNPYADYDKSSAKFRMVDAMERSILSMADYIIAITPLAKENYEQLLQVPSDKISCITNGYDEEDFKIVEKQQKNEKFTILHNGLLYSIRTPITFFEAVRQLIKEEKIDPDKISFNLTWTENDDLWKSHARNMGLAEIVKFHGYLSHQESLQLANESDMLLLLVGSGERNKAVYTGKVFEYLRLNKPILSLSPNDSLVDQLIQITNRGYNVDYNDIEGIKGRLLSLYTQWMNGDLPVYTVDEKVNSFERKQLTLQLTSIFNRVIEQNRI